MITPAIRYISSFQDATNSSSIPVPTPLMVDGRIWDQKNLNVSTYRSGRVIPQVKTGWSTLTTGAWRYYNDNPASATVYGRLYNWYAMMGIYDAASLADPSLRDNIAPVDWEVATYGEWITLKNILGRNVAAIALKESGPAHWGPTNTATNSSYFTALPGGYKLYSNNTGFNRLGTYGYWMSKGAVGYFRLGNDSNALNFSTTTIKTHGFSIRLIKPPTIIPGFTTTYPTTITSTSLLGTGGYIPTDYTGTITERGIVYSTSINPTIANTKIQSGSGLGSYTINITGLSVNTQYFIRAYAISSTEGVVYANNISVFTLNSTPTVFTNNISQITTNSAVSGGVIDNNGGLAIISKGVVWSTSPNPTIALSTKTNSGGGDGDFISDITGLALNTKYYVRAYATNSATTGYGDEKEFTTLAVPSLNLIFNQYYAYHAYSLRKLSDTYDYRCVRVRRTTASPNPVTTTTVDVLFNSYNEIGLDNDIILVSGTTTLATTLGEFADGIVDGLTVPSSIFVVTWYDQSGNNKNVTNSTLSAQPRLVNAGTLETSEGKAAVRFIAASANQLFTTDTSVALNNVSSYVVGNPITATSTNFYAINFGTRFYLPNTNNISYGTSGTWAGLTIIPNENRLYELICGTSTVSAYSNGLILSPASVASLNVQNTGIYIGRVALSPILYSDGHVSEVISFIGTPDRLNIEPNIMDYYGIQRLPSVTTADVNYIEPTGTAIGGGNLIDDFGITPTTKGVCWNTFPNPELGFGEATNNGTGIGAFTSSLTFLAAYTQYYVRAYASNSLGAAYGQQKQFTTGEAPMNLILDLYPSAYHAYSLRKLRSAYAGACLRVRRTTTTPIATTTTVDLYFNAFGTISLDSFITYVSGTNTTASTLGEFCASVVNGYSNPDDVNTNQNIFVVTWFDQSGTNINPTNATAGGQPRLVNSGNLEISNGKVAVRFISTNNNRLNVSSTNMFFNNLSHYVVATPLTGATTSQIFTSLNSTNSPRWYLPRIPTTDLSNIYISYSTDATHLSNANDGVTRLYSTVAGSSTYTSYRNTTPIGTGPSFTNATLSMSLGFSGNTTFAASANGYIQESLIWKNQSNVTNIQTNIINYYGL
jgi:uncharacterized protein (TIGR02145 family)